MKYIGCLLVVRVYAIQRLWYILAYLLAVFFYIYWPWGLIQYREMEHIQLCTVCNFVQRVAANELEKTFHLNYHSNYMLNNVGVLVDMLDIDCFLGPMYYSKNSIFTFVFAFIENHMLCKCKHMRYDF